MRATEPNDGEERRLLGGILLDEADGFRDDGIRAVARHFHWRAIAAEGPVGVEPVGNGKPFVETEMAGMQWIVGGKCPALSWLAAAEVPFAKMCGGIADFFDGLREGHLLFSQGHSGPESSAAVWIPAGHDTGAGRRATWMRRVEAIETQPGGGHRVEVGCWNFFQAVVADVAPTLIIRHAENDVRSGCRFGGKEAGDERDGTQDG